MESFLLDLSMSGDCGVTNSQGIEPFSYFGYFYYYAIGLTPMDDLHFHATGYIYNNIWTTKSPPLKSYYSFSLLHALIRSRKVSNLTLFSVYLPPHSRVILFYILNFVSLIRHHSYFSSITLLIPT